MLNSLLKDENTRKTFIKEIFIAVIILLLIEPLVKWIWGIIIWTGENIYQGFLNSIYKSAAQGITGKIEFYTLYLLIFVISSVIYFKFSDLTKQAKSLIEQGDRIIKANQVLVDDKDEEESDDKDDHIDILSEFDKAKKKLKRLEISAKIVLPLSFIFILILLITFFVTLELNSSFNQRLNVMLPYIPDNEVRVLKSLWASMRNRSDYMVIVSTMESLAASHDITLPGLQIK